MDLEEVGLVAIVRGSVRCGTDGATGGFIATPGFVLGADSALGGIPYCYDAVAETPVAAVSVRATALTDRTEDCFEVGRRSTRNESGGVSADSCRGRSES